MAKSEIATVTFQGQTFTCAVGANLRQVILQHQRTVHNGGAQIINCRGLGTCGTCAVQIQGAVSGVNWRDRARRSLPPHDPQRDLRLACQTQVLGDIQVTKYDGFWGQGAQPVKSPIG
ncbi:MAG: 2Fe-2S iron-sulfur cluster-binding protein [Leptolyngbyaceae cyanobacterium]